MNDSKKITEGALLTTVYSILLVIALFIPVLAIFIFFILPVPFIIFAARYYWKPSLLMGVAAILISVLIATGVMLPITLLTAIGGIVIGCAIHRGLGAYETWAGGTIGFAIGFVLVYAFIQSILQINIMEMVDDGIQQSLDTMDSLGITGMMPEEIYDMLVEQLEMVKDLVPAGIVLMSILFAFISQWLSYKMMNRVEHKNLYFPPFRLFNLPGSLIWIYFIALLLTFFELEESSFLYTGVINVIILASLLLTIQGYSLIFCFAHVKRWPKAIPIIGVVLGFILPGFVYLIRILGIIDLGFSVKHRLSQKKE